ncbi:MAG: type II toxin-antitoxin system HigB family toxin [Methylobacter sp.]|nr:type II toxin-antitoxin system HigB family toxin [Methylobacter sp.]
MVVAIAYRFVAVYIKFIGTHEQYDAIDAETIEFHGNPSYPGCRLIKRRFPAS